MDSGTDALEEAKLRRQELHLLTDRKAQLEVQVGTICNTRESATLATSSHARAKTAKRRKESDFLSIGILCSLSSLL